MQKNPQSKGWGFLPQLEAGYKRIDALVTTLS